MPGIFFSQGFPIEKLRSRGSQVVQEREAPETRLNEVHQGWETGTELLQLKVKLRESSRAPPF